MSEPQHPVPFTVIGGFLGAGKTTLLNKLLAQANIPKLTVLVNDFGDINIDAELIADHGGDTIALKNGCVCCSIGGDLGRTLSRVLSTQPLPEHIVVEASGVANPKKVLDIARASQALDPNGAIVLVDTPALAAQLADRWVADTVRMQIASADLLLLNKAQTLSPTELVQAGKLIDDLGIDTPRIDSGAVLWSLVSDLETRSEIGEWAQEHFDFTSRCVVSERIVSAECVENWLGARSDVYRAKGWVVSGSGPARVLQAVGRSIRWSPAESVTDARTRLVLIGRNSLPGNDEIIAALEGIQQG